MPFSISRRRPRKVLFQARLGDQAMKAPAREVDELTEAGVPVEEGDGETVDKAGRAEEHEAAQEAAEEEDEEFLFTTYSQTPFQDRTDPLPAPDIFTHLPPLRDLLHTETSRLQDLTIQECLPFMSSTDNRQWPAFNAFGIPRLDRQKHVDFLHQSLGDLPSGWVAADASRPWFLYWALTGLYLLGDDISQFRDRVIQTLTPMQNPDGGFGGGHGQMSHCAASYAAVLSLLMVGGKEALNVINRKTLWKWLGDLKQPDGGFQLCVGGEEDVRGAYCSMVMISLLNLPLALPPSSPGRKSPDDTFCTNLPEYLSRCQTYEGGISGTPGTEAHGGYAFCALACLCIMGPPHEMLPAYLDMPLLISWLSARQYAPEGGLSGRTNKLVDGCYSHWVGGCWPLVEAALNGPQDGLSQDHRVVGSLYSREGLGRYILCCCQGKRGGLRDKPSKNPDSYHTCYVLAGLSCTQYYWYYASPSDPDASITYLPLDAPYHWHSSSNIPTYEGGTEELIFEEGDRINVIHPVFVIPPDSVEEAKEYFGNKIGF